jgi:hypothetical protein
MKSVAIVLVVGAMALAVGAVTRTWLRKDVDVVTARAGLFSQEVCVGDPCDSVGLEAFGLAPPMSRAHRITGIVGAISGGATAFLAVLVAFAAISGRARRRMTRAVVLFAALSLLCVPVFVWTVDLYPGTMAWSFGGPVYALGAAGCLAAGLIAMCGRDLAGRLRSAAMLLVVGAALLSFGAATRDVDPRPAPSFGWTEYVPCTGEACRRTESSTVPSAVMGIVAMLVGAAASILALLATILMWTRKPWHGVTVATIAAASLCLPGGVVHALWTEPARHGSGFAIYVAGAVACLLGGILAMTRQVGLPAQA